MSLERRDALLIGLGLGLAAVLVTVSSRPTAPAPGVAPELPVATPEASIAGTAPSSWPTGLAVQVAPVADSLFELPERTWYDDRVMARVSGDPQAVARSLGAELLRTPGPSGLVGLRVPADTDRDAFLAALQAHPAVLGADRVGAVYGAGKGKGKGKGKDTDSSSSDSGSGSSSSSSSKSSASSTEWSATYGDYQWHLEPAAFDESITYHFRDVIVAVLDSGVAYEDHSDDSGDYVALPGLSQSKFVNPYDFINDDRHANDDNQHGTHIACLIACTGETLGVAPEAKIMPVKVLDANLEGDELALVDGLWHAIDNGAHVINLSLSFAPGYAPSAELLDALQAAYEADILVVAAAGNWSGRQATWPARSPLVMGVAATELDSWTVDSNGVDAEVVPTAYTNVGTGVVITAPGGNLDQDVNGDGLPDGLLAESISPDDPSTTGLWLMSGSSQAAALVSGAALSAYAEGYGRQEAWGAVLVSTGGHADNSGLESGVGTGRLKIRQAHGKVTSHAASTAFEHTVSFLPYLVDNGDGTVTPTALVHVVDQDGAYDGAEVYVSFNGASDAIDSCEAVDASGCVVSGEAVSATDSDGSEDELWWTVSIDGVATEGAVFPAFSALYSSDALNAAIESIEADEGAHVPLGWYWESGTDDDLGELAESAVILDVGAGFASSPMGLLMNQRTVDTWFTVEEVSIDLDGSGFASSPMGRSNVRYMRGSGFASSPMGKSRAATMRGSGFASSPMGFAVATHSDDTSGDHVFLYEDWMSRKQLRTPLGDAVSSGGWVLDSGAPVAAAIAASLGGEADDAIQALSTDSEEVSP